MAAEHTAEDEASQLKRKAIRALMFDKSLTSAERTKQIQLIMSGKIEPGAERSAAAAAPVKNSGGGNDDDVGGADKPQSPTPAAASDTALSFEEKLRAKMNEINMRSSSSKSYREDPKKSDEVEGTIGGGEDSTVDLGTIGEGDDSTLELGTVGGGEDSTIDGGEDNTVELGTIGDESDLSSLESKSSFTSRNWANRFRAAALEAKIAAKISKAGGTKDNQEELKEDGEESDGEYTFESASCFSLELNEEPSSSQGVGNGSLPIQEEDAARDEEVPMNATVSAISPVDNSSDDIEVFRHSFSPTLSMRDGDEPNVPNLSNPDGLAVATAVAPDDEPDYVFQGENNPLT